MMGNCCEEEEGQFFYTREDISSVSDRHLGCSEGCSSSVEMVNSVSGHSQYEIWTKYPESVTERRRKFLELIDLSLDRNLINRGDSGDISFDESQSDVDRISEKSGAVLSTSGFEDEMYLNQSSICSLSFEVPGPVENGALVNNFACRSKTSDNRKEFEVGETGQDLIHNRVQQLGSSQSVSFDEFQRTPGSSSPLIQRFLSRGSDESSDFVDGRKMKRGWLRKLGAVARLVDRRETAALKPADPESTSGPRMQKVRVHPLKKSSKELSSLYIGQEFAAHEGSILTMKFSLDGKYLASAGEDGTVRVWKVIEDKGLDKFDIQEIDPSCLYFTINELSQSTPLDDNKEKLDRTRNLRRSPDSTCVILPPKIFRILEKPLHEFRGHSDEVLGLSWSKNGFLLSSSVDKTVRLWQVGCNRCLRVFSHNNYVTCVAFNPIDDNYFISGSIDGKVRIWEILRCQVVDYTDIREIVSAVCYLPDGKGGIVGSMTGNCRFYDIIDNRLHQRAQVCLQSKKKLPGKRITGFQFSPTDPSKVIVTSADSLVRILCGVDVIGKFKASGYRIAGSQIFATFTSDGKHVVSASEDSNVYIWNYPTQDKSSSRAKSIWSCESFLAHDTSIAIPWCGVETVPGTIPSPTFGGEVPRNTCGYGQKHDNLDTELDQKLPHSSPDCFSLARGFLLEHLTRGAATWPEEKLPNASPKAHSPLSKSKLKLLKSACQGILSSPHLWGLVIVTASWDGRIRTYLNYGLPIRL